MNNLNIKKKILGRFLSKLVKNIFSKYYTKLTINRINILNYKHFLLSGNKKKNKILYIHTGYPGGLKKINFYNKINKKYFLKSLKGMLPKNKIGKIILKKIII
ncbi:uL13 family ribosomal protein [Candidatus Vidania fulgoroideorum]